MRVLVAGGAGFLGSHLCDHYWREGHEVVCLDNLVTGSRPNLAGLEGRERFLFVEADASLPPSPPGGAFDLVFNLASPASPVDYLRLPLETLRVGAIGTENLLRLARERGAAFIQASTSEVYGDPRVHPQPETYWGNVNPIGPRSVYDEGKRYGEALVAAWHRQYSLPVGIVRIFNTYGPRLRPSDGRVVSNFIVQALEGRPLTVYGDGSQTRSLCYVSDLVAGLAALAARALEPFDGPGEFPLVNLGNPGEVTMLELARRVIALCGSASPIVRRPLPTDDPVRRCPDISLARTLLGWRPVVGVDEGLALTVDWFRNSR